MMNRLNASLLTPLSLGVLLFGCGEQPQDAAAQAPVAQVAETSDVKAPPPEAEAVPTAQAAAETKAETASVEKGMFFKPNLEGFALHNESDADGDGDGVNETHVRRYINKAGDTVFSMTTNDKLWAWSLDTKGDDDSDIKKNFVIRNSDCNSVFDERYSLDAEYHVPTCLQGGVKK